MTSTPLRVELLVPVLRLGPIAMDLRHIGGVTLSDVLAPVLDGTKRREGDTTVWPLAIPDGITVQLPLPFGRFGVGSQRGRLVVEAPPAFAGAMTAWGRTDGAVIQHADGCTRLLMTPEALDGLKLPLPGMAEPVRFRARA